MDKEEMLEQTNEPENVDTQTTEEVEEGTEITDTTESEDTGKEKEEVKSLKELLESNPSYQEELNAMFKTRLRRKDREHEKELAQYRDIENVLKATVGGDNTEEIRVNLRNAYSTDGVELPEYNSGLTSEETEVLAKYKAISIIDEGYDAMVEEANRLADKKYKNLNPEEKIIFNTLAEKITEQNDCKELLSIGASESLLSDKEFIEFRKQFNSKVSIKDIYTLYKLKHPKTAIENPGSMKSGKTNEPKTIFTDDDIAKMTPEELDKNWDAIRAYQTRQK